MRFCEETVSTNGRDRRKNLSCLLFGWLGSMNLIHFPIVHGAQDFPAIFLDNISQMAFKFCFSFEIGRWSFRVSMEISILQENCPWCILHNLRAITHTDPYLLASDCHPDIFRISFVPSLLSPGNDVIPEPELYIVHYVVYYLSNLLSMNLASALQWMYRVTHQVKPNLPLTSTQKFCFGLAWSGQAKRNLCFYVNGRFGSTWCVTLYILS